MLKNVFASSRWAPVAGIALFAAVGSVQAQQVTLGFDRVAEARALNEEIVRQPDLWMMECQLKPVRLVWIDVIDPATNEVKKEQIWYLPWRAIRRPIAGRGDEDLLPVNELDPLPGPLQFVPQFTLITYDNPQSEIPLQILPDEYLPTAMAQIKKMEKGPYRDMVGVVQDVPEAIAKDAEQQKWIWGIAMWRNVDPDTDFFKIIVSGCTNGYEVKTLDDGTRQIWRKVLVQKFYRPGDRFDPNLKEFQYSDQPQWTFQPDPLPVSGDSTSAAGLSVRR